MNFFRTRLASALVAFLIISSISLTNAQTTSVSGEEISARMTDLSSNQTSLPDNDLMLFDELRRVDDEISRYRRNIGLLRDRRPEGQNIEQVKDQLASALSQAKQLDCKSATPLATGQARRRLAEGVSALSQLVFRRDLEVLGSNPWEVGADEYLTEKPKRSCEDLQNYIGDPSREQSLFQYLENAKKKLAEVGEAQDSRIKQATSLVDLLQKRRAQIQEKLSARTTQQQISGSLWIVISVIGGFSILAILAVKLFSEQLQMEWVVSGQVIQFVTVMILLSVVMALGLANILKENTLGTLLGGIAGYVLAQGVGRAAAREVSRGNAARVNSETTATSLQNAK